MSGPGGQGIQLTSPLRDTHRQTAKALLLVLLAGTLTPFSTAFSVPPGRTYCQRKPVESSAAEMPCTPNGTVLTVSPFYHFSRAHYAGDYTGVPDPSVSIPQDDRGSNYLGGVVSAAYTRGRHAACVRMQLFGERDNQLFAVTAGDGTVTVDPQREIVDQYKPRRWLTLNAGLRLTHFGGTGTDTRVGGSHPISENAADPRLGGALQIPKLHWVARAFWGRYYQAPPLLSVSGPLVEQCDSASCPSTANATSDGNSV